MAAVFVSPARSASARQALDDDVWVTRVVRRQMASERSRIGVIRASSAIADDHLYRLGLHRNLPRLVLSQAAARRQRLREHLTAKLCAVVLDQAR